MNAKLRMGVIGLGEVGKHHVAGVSALRNAELVAVADFNSALLQDVAAATGAKAFVSGDDLLADPSIEAVSVCIPHKLHMEMCDKALRAGKHVLVEKPMAVSSEECRRLIAVAETMRRTLAVSHNQLFYPPHRWLHNQIRNAGIARPSMLRLRLAIGGKYGGWRSDPDLTGGGILFDAGFHRFYVARLLMGEVKGVTAQLDTAEPRRTGENSGLVILEFAEGGLGVIEAGYFGPKGVFDDQIEVVSRDKLIRIPGIEAHFEKFSQEPDILVWADGVWKPVGIEQCDWAQTVHRSIEDFAKAIEAQRPPAVDGHEGLKVVELVEAAYRSSRERRRVEIA